MITFDKINRRTHLYLGLFLMPWLLMYGASSFLIIHQSWFPTDKPARELLFEKAYSRPVNLQGANSSPELRAAAQEILKDCNLEGAFWGGQTQARHTAHRSFQFSGFHQLELLHPGPKTQGHASLHAVDRSQGCSGAG